MTKQAFSLFVCFVLLNAVYGQKDIITQNNSEKYADAYKKYLNATCPIPKDSIQHFVYFSRDREKIIDHPLLSHPMFKGAQIMYSWKDFEPQKDQYDFSI
jgi:hypothetical protein